ncbi:hypothetical protein ACL02S_23315 [Nocardia sp. 004]|uniref:hypothetical protein n=1 Tax=Nocardia sp. 004 TaxID=3385978 RepID=UPI00399FA811
MSKLKIFAAVSAAALILLGTIIVHQLTGDRNHVATDSHTDISDPLDPTAASPETVAVNAITIIHTWRPSQDDSAWQALHRAHALLTDPIVRAAATAPDPPPRPIPEWDSWSRSHDQINAVVIVAKAALLEGDDATVVVRMTQLVIHPDGATTPYQTSLLRVQLHHVDGKGWLVSHYQPTQETP